MSPAVDSEKKVICIGLRPVSRYGRDSVGGLW